MKNKLLRLGLTCTALAAAVPTYAQYCMPVSPESAFDTNLQGLELIGETTTINYLACQYPNPWDPITEPTGYGAIGPEDQTAQVADLIAGSAYSIDVEWGSCGGNYDYAGTVWIDFNGNELFEASEVIGEYQSPFGGGYFDETYNFVVPANALNGTHRMRVIEQEGGVLPLDPCGYFYYGSLTDFSITITGGTDCAGVSDILISSIGTDSVSLSWTAGGTEMEWEIEYGLAGFTPGTGTSVLSTDLTETINGLTENTEYDFYIAAICGPADTSSALWAPALTNCQTVTGMGMCESFESDSETIGCWRAVNANEDEDYEWTIQGDLQPHSGMYSAMMYTDYNGGNNDDWLISPRMTLTGNEVLNFWYSVYSEWEPNTFEVLLSTTGSNPSDFTNVLMAPDDYGNYEWADTTVDLSAYTGDVYIAFHIPTAGLDGWYLFIDDVCVDVCVPPAGTDGQMDVCRTDMTVDLNSVVTQGMETGTWEFELNQNLIQDSIMDYSSLVSGTYEVQYVVLGGCTNDTTVASITIFDAPNAGIDGVIDVCMSQPFDLLSGLDGTIDLNGTWYNPSGNAMTSSYTNSGSLPGPFNYTYVVSNGVCPDETANVTVLVDGTCNFLGVEEQILESVSVYPNPTTGMFSISAADSDNDYTYDVLDFSGRQVIGKSGKLSSAQETNVDLSDCQAGVYLVRISNGEHSKMIRLVLN